LNVTALLSEAVRPHVHLGVLIAATMLVLGLAMAVIGPRLIRGRPASNHSADEDRSDRKHWNNDASLQFRE